MGHLHAPAPAPAPMAVTAPAPAPAPAMNPLFPAAAAQKRDLAPSMPQVGKHYCGWGGEAWVGLDGLGTHRLPFCWLGGASEISRSLEH
jgi:hypothetical protein